MKYKKIFHTQREPHFLNVLFPTILPFDWLMVIWFLLTFRARKARSYIHGIPMVITVNKLAKVCLGDEYVADLYSISNMDKSEILTEMFRFCALLNESEKDEKDS